VLNLTTTWCRMDWYHLADRRKRDTTVKWVQDWSVGTGSAKISRESQD
jgi:alkaline phosphatase/alkaline phosphatase D